MTIRNMRNIRAAVRGSAAAVLTACVVAAPAHGLQVVESAAQPTARAQPADTVVPVRAPVPFLGAVVAAPQDSVWKDAWGQPKNFGLGVAEAYLANFVPWVVNELLPARAELKISQISPRSWKRNIKEGWKWDDNNFSVNYFAHPFQGNMYFNGARTNGYGYWTGLAFATAGSFHWECCGESHLMSINDWVNTAVGGAAVGEVLYRTSSMVLDNEATGSERIWREVGAFALNPMRGLTRLVSGNTTRVYRNPENPSDHHPDRLESVLTAGVRLPNGYREWNDTRVDDDYPNHGYFNLQLLSGSLAELDRNTPFDYFSLSFQVNFVKERGLGEIKIQGNLWQKELKRTDKTISKFVVLQDFEFEDTGSFQQGGQGATLTYYHHRIFSDRNSSVWNLQAGYILLGAVKSELAYLADVEGIREGFRAYDFGMGPGFGGAYYWVHDGRRLVTASYRFKYLTTLNGGTAEGQGSNHTLQTFRLRGMLPFTRNGFGVGADYQRFDRRSTFDIAEIGQVRQKSNQFQVFLSYNPVKRTR